MDDDVDFGLPEDPLGGATVFSRKDEQSRRGARIRSPGTYTTVDGTQPRRRTRARAPVNLDRRGCRSPRFDGVRFSYDALINMVRTHDMAKVVQYAQNRYRHQKKAVLQARREDVGVAVSLVYSVLDDPNARDRFNDMYEREFGREPKPGRIGPEVFRLLYGEERKDLAGTDAMAMREAIARRIPAASIPDYIKRMGGLQKLLDNERARRKPGIEMKVLVLPDLDKRIGAIEAGGSLWVELKRNKNKHSPRKYALIRAR